MNIEKFDLKNRGQSLIGIIVVLVAIGLIGGGVYYYFSKQIPETPEITKKLTEEKAIPSEEAAGQVSCAREITKAGVTCGGFFYDDYCENLADGTGYADIIQCRTSTGSSCSSLVTVNRTFCPYGCRNRSCVLSTISPPEEIIPIPEPEKPIVQKCADGTLYSQCSINKPKYCDNGNLIDKCSVCDCPLHYSCNVISDLCKLLPPAELPTVIFDDGALHEPGSNIPRVTEISKIFYQNHADIYDFLFIFSTTPLALLNNPGFHVTVKNNVEGIGANILDWSRDLGSAGKLLGINFNGAMDLDVSDSYKLTINDIDKVGGAVYEGMFHELIHQWLVFVGCKSDENCSLPVQRILDPFHWDTGLDSPYEYTLAKAHRKWIDNGDGTFTTISSCPVNYFSRLHPLDFYLMGLKDINELPDNFFVVKPEGGYSDFVFSCNKPTTVKGTKSNFSIQDIIKNYGKRIPSYANSQKDFSSAIILLESANYPATEDMKNRLKIVEQNAPAIWNWLTEGRSTLNFPHE